MDSKNLIRASAGLLVIGTCGAALYGGAAWGMPFLLAGAVALANLYLLSLLAKNLIRPPAAEGEAAEPDSSKLAIGLLVKFVGTGVALVLLVRNFEVAPVLFGFGVVVVAIIARGAIDPFLPPETQEA